MGDSNKCYKCGKSGHWARACHTRKRDNLHYVSEKQEIIKNKVTRCFVCRKLGHLARECPNGEGSGKYYDLDRPMEMNRRNDEPPPPPNFAMDNHPYGEIDGSAIVEAFDSIDEREWDFMKNENQKEPSGEIKQTINDSKLTVIKPRETIKYFKTVFLSNTKFSGFLDTCSEKCLIKYSAAKKAQLNVQLDDTDVMANSPTFKCKIVSIGKATTVITIDTVEVANVELFVVNDDVLNVDIVIGRSWLDQPHIMVLKMDDTVHLEDITVHPFDKIRNIFSNLDIKSTGKKSVIDSRLDAVSSSDDDVGKGSKTESLPKKPRHNRSKFDYKDIDEPAPRKHPHEVHYERERGRDLPRERSRSRTRRVRDSSRDRMLKLGERLRRSRDRSRDRFMSRHSGRH